MTRVPTPSFTAVDGHTDVDPLDAYMASIASQVDQQRSWKKDVNDKSAGEGMTAATVDATTAPLASRHRQQPCLAQLDIMRKVAASPFCDVLKRTRGGFSASSSNSGTDPMENGNLREDRRTEGERKCLAMLLEEPADFLRRYGHILSPTDLGSFLPSQDPAVALHVARLQTLMSQQRRHVAAAPSNDLDEDDVDMTAEGTTVALPPTGLDHGGVGAGISGGHTSERSFPPDGPRARNRRYRRLQQLAAGGVWFSDEAMKEKDPWLWFEYVGRREGEEKPAPKAATEKVPGSTTVATYLQESLGFLSQQQDGDWLTGGNMPASMRGAGPSLGMAFLSGMCSAEAVGGQVESGEEGMEVDTADDAVREEEREQRQGQEVPSVNAGEMVDVSDVPAASPAKAAGVPVGRSGGVLVRSDGRGGDTTLDITAAVEAFGIGGRRDSSHASCPGNADAANGKRDVSGGDGESVRDEPRRVRFVDESGLDSDGGRDKNQERESDLMQEENQVEGGDEEEGEAEEAGREGGRAEVARIMSERFLAGKVPGVNYKDVDEDERLDDLEQIASDEQDRWFQGAGDEATDVMP